MVWVLDSQWSVKCAFRIFTFFHTEVFWPLLCLCRPFIKFYLYSKPSDRVMGAQSLPNSLPVSTAQTKATGSVAYPHHRCGSGTFFEEIWIRLFIWCGSGSCFSLWCVSSFQYVAYGIRIRLWTLLRIRIRNTSYESLLCFRLSNWLCPLNTRDPSGCYMSTFILASWYKPLLYLQLMLTSLFVI